MAHLLIIDLPGGNDVDLLHAARDAGHTFSFLTADLALYEGQPPVRQALAAALETIDVPGFDYAEVEARVLASHARRPIEAVLCLIDIRLTEAARLARRLGLRYLNPESARLLRDKFSVRSRLAALGHAQPAFALALSNEDLAHAVQQLGLPVLIKPADGYGSQNIVVLREPDDLAPWMSPLACMLPSGADYGLGVRANDRLLVERYMAGSLIGCDTLTVDGRHTLLGINEKRMFAPPSFAIEGGCFSTSHPQWSTIEPYVHAVLDAVGFDWGATHIELMLTDDGPRLVEVNARLVGARIPRLINHALGRSVHQDLIDVHLGRWTPHATTSAPARCAATRWITASEPGVFDGLQWPRWTDPGVCGVDVVKQPGDPVRPPFENVDRIACVMTSGASREDAERLAARYVADTTVLTREAVEAWQRCDPRSAGEEASQGADGTQPAPGSNQKQSSSPPVGTPRSITICNSLGVVPVGAATVSVPLA
jgi:biotin carboxylase